MRARTDTKTRRIAGPVASWYVADILRGAPPPLNAPFGQIAYKTGTSYGYRDAFAIGFDKAHTIAVWLGRPGQWVGVRPCRTAGGGAGSFRCFCKAWRQP